MSGSANSCRVQEFSCREVLIRAARVNFHVGRRKFVWHEGLLLSGGVKFCRAQELPRREVKFCVARRNYHVGRCEFLSGGLMSGSCKIESRAGIITSRGENLRCAHDLACREVQIRVACTIIFRSGGVKSCRAQEFSYREV